MAWKEMMRWRRSKSEVSVEITDPHHVFKPGESVSGCVVMDLNTTAAQAKVFVNFKGALRLRSAKPQIKVQESVIFDEDVLLCDKVELQSGKHSFPFELELPMDDNVLGSIEFDLGSIAYTVRGRVELLGSKATKQSIARSVKVSTSRDVSALNQRKNVSLIVNVSKRKTARQVVLKLMIPKRGWLPGDVIPIKLHVQHQWSVQGAASIAVTLSRISKFVVDGSEYIYRKDLSQNILGLYTDKDKAAELNTTLKVPPESLISASTKFITFSYLVEVMVDVNGKLDMLNWANSNPTIKIIDTDRVRGRPGVVSAWAEIVIGSTCSSTPASASRAETQSDVIHANLTPPSSLASSEQRSHSSHNSSSIEAQAMAQAVTPALPVAQSPLQVSEKMILATRAQTLMPSVPEYSAPEELPSAPTAGNGVWVAQGDEKAAMRLRQLASDPSDCVPAYEYVPATNGTELAPSAPPLAPPLMSSAPPLMHPTRLTPVSSSQTTLERNPPLAGE